MHNTNEVIKHSAVIAISNTLSLFERRLWNHLLANAFLSQKESVVFKVAIAALKEKMGFDSKNIEYLKNALRNLVKTVVEFNLLGKDKTERWASSLLSSVEIKNGVCEYAFSPLLFSKLFNPAMYAKLNLELINRFDSKYALAMYELFADYKEVYQTPLMRLDDFKKIMGVEYKYSEFKSLSKRVIAPALKEVNSLVDCNATAEYIKEWKSVSALKFYFTIPPKPQDDKSALLYQKLTGSFKLSPYQAKSVISSYPAAYIEETLSIVKAKRVEWTIKNIAAFTLSLIKNDYAKPTTNKLRITPISGHPFRSSAGHRLR